MSIVKEFRDFIARGNVIDLAVGVVIGAAFGKIVSSLVADIIMPPLGLVVGGINFSHLHIDLKPAIPAIEGVSKGQPAVVFAYGNFLQNIFDFLLVAMAIFGVVKLSNKIKKPPVAPPTPPEVVLLTEIRDALVATKKPSALP
jgi:large conductance mechanosensitive channel